MFYNATMSSAKKSSEGNFSQHHSEINAAKPLTAANFIKKATEKAKKTLKCRSDSPTAESIPMVPSRFHDLVGGKLSPD